MTQETPTKLPAIRTGQRFNSVSAMLDSEGVSASVRTQIRALESATKLVDRLTALRHAAGITQEQMASEMDLSQSAISKLENGDDANLTVGQIAAYAKATNERLALQFGKPLNHVESVKAHALGMRNHMLALANIAGNYTEMERDIQAFFGEAFFNILNILSECDAHLPNGGNVEVRLVLMDKEPMGGAGNPPIAPETQNLVPA